MAVLTLATQRPDDGIRETWTWPTDVMIADDGTEQRVSLTSLPKRSWSGTYFFDETEDMRRHLALMFAKFKTTFNWPLFHQSTLVKTALAGGESTLYCNTVRSDLRSGSSAYLYQGEAGELVVIDAVGVDNVTIIGTVVGAYSRALLCPVMEVYTSEASGIVRKAVNNASTATFRYFANDFLTPFIPPGDVATLTMFNDYPVVDVRPVGNEFGQTLRTGTEIIDYGGVPTLRDRWISSQWAFPLTFQINTGSNPQLLRFWRTFADYARGGTNPFYVPTWREDMELLTPPAGLGTTMTFVGSQYREHYFPIPSFRTIAIRKLDGTVHYATVTNAADSAGNDAITFAPAVPAGDWSSAEVSFMHICRIADDTVSLEHYALHSLLTISLQTVDG